MTRYIKYLFLLLASIQFLTVYADTPVVEYLKNGESNLYSTAHIDSVTFSCFDLDSIAHPVIVTQVIWYDGIPYRTLLEDVDKVSLRTPKAELQPNTYEISEELYMATRSVDYDDFTIKLITGCNEKCVPEKGDKIFTFEMNDIYPMGFMGEVVDVQPEVGGGIILHCEPADYDDIFKSYFGSFERTLYGETIPDSNRARVVVKSIDSELDNQPQSYRATLPTFDHSLSLDFVTPMTISGFDLEYERELKIRQIPTFTVSNIVYVENGKKLRHLSFDGNLEITVNDCFQGNAKYDKKIPLFDPSVPIPVAPMLCAYAEVGVLAGIDIQDVSMNFSMTRNFAIKGGCTFEESQLRNLKFDRTNPNEKSDGLNIFVSGKGHIDLGGYIELGIETVAEKFWKKTGIEKFSCGKLNVFFQGGLRCSANAQFSQEDWDSSKYNTNLYHKLSQPGGVKVGLFGTAGVEASILMLSKSIDKTFESKPFFEKSVLPVFTKTEINDSQRYFLDVETPYKAGITQPLLGFVAYDITESASSPVIADSYNAGKMNSVDGSGHAIFEKPKKGVKYRIHPYLQLYGKQILGMPYADYIDNETEIPNPKCKMRLIDEYVDYRFGNPESRYPTHILPYWEVAVQMHDMHLQSFSTRSTVTTNIRLKFDTAVATRMGINCDSGAGHYPDFEIGVDEYSYTEDILTFNVKIPLNWGYLKRKSDGTYIVIFPAKIQIYDQLEIQEYPVILAKEYTPTHNIRDVKFEFHPNYTCYPLSYNGSVSGSVVYGLMDLWLNNYQLYVKSHKAFDAYTQIYGVAENLYEGPNGMSLRIRDGQYSRIFPKSNYSFVNERKKVLTASTASDMGQVKSLHYDRFVDLWITWLPIPKDWERTFDLLPSFEWISIDRKDSIVEEYINGGLANSWCTVESITPCTRKSTDRLNYPFEDGSFSGSIDNIDLNFQYPQDDEIKQSLYFLVKDSTEND